MAEPSSIEERVYHLSGRLGVTQGQVNTLFTVLEDLKASMQSIASDLKVIRKDVHDSADAKTKITALEENVSTVNTKFKELDDWKTEMKGQVTGAMWVIGAIAFVIPIAIEIYVK